MSLLSSGKISCIYVLFKILFLITLFYNMYILIFSSYALILFACISYQILQCKTLCRNNYLEDTPLLIVPVVDNFCGNSLVQICFFSANNPAIYKKVSQSSLLSDLYYGQLITMGSWLRREFRSLRNCRVWAH